MRIVYSPHHRLHHGVELDRGRLVAAFDKPVRADIILGHVSEAGLGELGPALDFGDEPILRVHDPAYVAFLRTAHERWRDAGNDTYDHLLPRAWPARGVRNPRLPSGVQGEMNYHASDSSASIMYGTWSASRASAHAALTAAQALTQGACSAFALCRPPGHHASRDQLGGYCYLNNAAIAAQWLLDHGAHRVAVLDVDYHHGHGTQAIFYDRSDVLFVSMHGHPATDYPFFQGYEDEIGEGTGEGYTLNLPMPPGTGWDRYHDAIRVALARVSDYGPDVLVVSLGVDTYEGDPLGRFLLKTDDFARIGQDIASVDRPTLFVLEGGYAAEALGSNVVSVLRGFEDTRRQVGKPRRQIGVGVGPCD